MAEAACAPATAACAASSCIRSCASGAATASAAASALATSPALGTCGAADAGPASTPRVSAAVRTTPSAVPSSRPAFLRGAQCTEATSSAAGQRRRPGRAPCCPPSAGRSAQVRAAHPGGGRPLDGAVRASPRGVRAGLLVDLAVGGPEGLTQLELLDLPGGGAGQLVTELDPLGDLVPGDLAPAVRDDLLRGDLPALRAHDERGDQLAPLVVGDADDGDLRDGRVAEHGVLDLDGGDVLAAGDDHVLLAVGDREVAALVDRAAVAGVEPAALQCLAGGVGVLPVAGEHRVALHQHLTGVAGPHAGAQRRDAGPGQLAGPLLRLQAVELLAGPVDGDQGGGLC